MANTNQIGEIGPLVHEPARAAMLMALMDGRALTATELARVAGITPQTASDHLAKLAAAGLLAVARQGRHRYHRLASPAIARLLASLMPIAAAAPDRKLRVGPRDAALRAARTCYDHLAGELAVAIADALLDRGAIAFDDDAGLITETGAAMLSDADISVPEHRQTSSRPLCRPCLDWSERRPHVAGQLGAAIHAHFFDHGWVKRVGKTRTLTVTPGGTRALETLFGISAWP